MIVPPRRAVTRFFVPLIDVLILLFCIFLLMPFVSEPPSETPNKKPPVEPLPDSVPELQRQLAEARARLARMERTTQLKLADRLSVRVLQIDKRDGTLYYFDPDRQEVRTEADAQRLIVQQKTIASTGGGVKDVLFLILYPTESSGFPTKKQEEQIKHWFRDVAHKFE